MTSTGTVLVDTRRSALSPGELTALGWHGVLRPVLGPLMVPWGVPLSAALRWEALQLLLADVLPEGGVVADAAAAWLWAGGPPPERLDVAVTRLHRAPDPGAFPLRLRDGVPPQRWVLHSGALAVTNPQRTIVEVLARTPVGQREREHARCLDLAARCGLNTRARLPDGILEGLSPRQAVTVQRQWERLRRRALDAAA